MKTLGPRPKIERAIEMLRDYKVREERIVRGLGVIQQAIEFDDLKKAGFAISSLMQTDLKDARQSAYDQDAALRIAVAVLQRHDKNRDVADAVSQIRALVPEVFEAPAAVGVS